MTVHVGVFGKDPALRVFVKICHNFFFPAAIQLCMTILFPLQVFQFFPFA